MSASIDPTVVNALRSLALTFLRKVHDGELEVFAEALDDLPAFDVVRACREIAKHERFYPKPATIRHWVDKLRREATPAPSWRPPTSPEMWTDPDTGEQVAVYTCHACQDTGWVPLTADKVVISWDAVRGVGQWLGRPIARRTVDYCTTCNRLRKPTKPTRRHTFDDEQDDRRR